MREESNPKVQNIHLPVQMLEDINALQHVEENEPPALSRQFANKSRESSKNVFSPNKYTRMRHIDIMKLNRRSNKNVVKYCVPDFSAEHFTKLEENMKYQDFKPNSRRQVRQSSKSNSRICNDSMRQTSGNDLFKFTTHHNKGIGKYENKNHVHKVKKLNEEVEIKLNNLLYHHSDKRKKNSLELIKDAIYNDLEVSREVQKAIDEINQKRDSNRNK